MAGKILEHTSDLYIEGQGKDLKEAICEVAKIMFKNMGEAKKQNAKIEITATGYDKQIMIIEFFSKILSECESELMIPKKLKIKKIDVEKKRIEATIFGETGTLKNIIKAVTYNSFVLDKTNEKTKLRILFDI
ncbi:MAG: archease [Candidatus Micrarchaeia archaeon]